MLDHVYLVEWVDSAAVEGWQDAEDYIEPITCVTVGRIVKNENDYITIAATVDENGRWCSGMAIPRAVIKRMHVWNPDADS